MQITQSLTPAVVEFLASGTRTGHLAYLASDGRPLTTPVWFVIDDGALVFATGRDTPKGRLLAKDPRVAVSVDLQEPPEGGDIQPHPHLHHQRRTRRHRGLQRPLMP